LFERAISRADLPIRYSQGFNPRPQLWLPLPRAVGIESDDELLMIELERPESPAWVFQQLAGQLPGSIVLREAFAVSSQAVPRPVEATYRLELADPPGPELAEAARRIMTADRLEVRRSPRAGNPARSIDLRGWIVRVDVTGNAILMTLSVSPEGSARPAEMLELLGLSPTGMLPRLRRVAVRWEGLEAGQATA
jgi:radical SAM-linked protein